VAKLSPAGDSLLFSTYLGGSSFDFGYAIALDAAMNIYVTGETENFPLVNPVQSYYAGNGDVFVAKITNQPLDVTPPSFGDCPTGGPFLLNSGTQPVGPITANDEQGGSGLNESASTLTGSVDISTVGTKTITFVAIDNAGNQATKDCDYAVIYNFTGFFQPVDNPPTYNEMTAGRQVQFKFSLSGDQGVNIIATGYPQSQRIDCTSQAPIDPVEETTTGPSGLRYDAAADQYIYAWQTNSTWAGTCRQFVMRLNDGTDHEANFKFR
jgi:hypothetical protein